MFYFNKDKELSIDYLKKFIEIHKSEVVNYKKLEQYYLGQNTKIKNRTFQDASKPNNKIAHPYAKYISDKLVGYFMGNPIDIQSTNTEFLLMIEDVLNYADTNSVNSTIAHYNSIYGVAYELIYLDEQAKERIVELNPQNTFVIYSDAASEDILYGIRYNETMDILTNRTTTNVIVYSDDSVKSYLSDESGNLTLVDEVINEFEQVPITPFRNNMECLGDFQLVVDLIDAYDILQADALNGFEYLNDCYLVMENEPEDVEKMKENRIIVTQGNVQWLTKNASDAEMENMKTRLIKEIHKMSACPDIAQDKNGGTETGKAVEVKHIDLENLTATKERYFKKSLQRRLELLTTMINKKNGSNFVYTDLDIVFTRNVIDDATFDGEDETEDLTDPTI